VIGYRAIHDRRSGTYASTERREFTRVEVALVGKLRRYGDSVVRFLVRLYDGEELFVVGTEQPDDDRKWIYRVGRQIPFARTTREVPDTLAWVNVPDEE
jgi:hypothetical protein